MRIAIYSGSFNPLHIGHLAVLEEVDRCGLFDWTYLVVSPKNPLKDSARAETGRERLRAAVQAVSRHPQLRVWVDDIELDIVTTAFSGNTAWRFIRAAASIRKPSAAACWKRIQPLK